MPRPRNASLQQQADVATRPMSDLATSALLRAVLVASGDAILVTDLDHRSLACNKKFGRLFGVSAEQAVHMEPEELRRRVYPKLADPQGWKRQLDEIYADPNGVHQDEIELLGEMPLVLMRWTGPVNDESGKVVARLWTFRDISAQRRRERMRDALLELGASREAGPGEVCRMVVEKLSQFYKAGAIISIREGDRMVFREVAGMPFPFNLARSNKVENSYCQLALETMKPFMVQDGREHPKLSRIPPVRYGFTRYLGVPITDRAGQPIGTLCIMDGKSGPPLDRDDEEFLGMMGLRVSTELYREKLYLERNAEQRATLEAQKRELTEELKATQRRLIQSEKLNVVGSLSAGIAHDIRNIVSSLSLECSLGDVDPGTALANVRSQLDRFAVLAHRLLSYGSPLLVAKEPVDLNEIVGNVLTLTRAQAKVAGVRLVATYSEELPCVLADASQVEHLLVNLVLNAVQAISHSEGLVVIKTTVLGSQAEIRVTDNGCGIAEEDLPHLFQPFRSDRSDGFGLGLYSCQRIVDEHNWTLAVESEKDLGTTFRIGMPLCEGMNA